MELTESRFPIEEISRDKKVRNTVNRSLNKSNYLLGGDFDRSIAETMTEPMGNEVAVYAPGDHEFYFRLYEATTAIRLADDVIDEELYAQRPIPADEIQAVISGFESEHPDMNDVADLFKTELKLMTESDYGKPDVRRDIWRSIRLSPSDFLFLIDEIMREQGSVLSRSDYETSRRFVSEFQVLVDFVNEILSVKGDTKQGEFNALWAMKAHEVDHDEIFRSVEGVIDEMYDRIKRVDDEDHRKILRRSADHWVSFYRDCQVAAAAYLDGGQSYERQIFTIKQTV